VTLVELLVALAVASILILGLIAAFQTTQRTAAIGEAREHIYQNARVALDLMAREIKNAYIDPRNRDLIFISADGLAARNNSILEYNPATPADPNAWIRGLGNAQVPFGVDLTNNRIDNEAIRLYADETFGYPIFSSAFSVKAINDIYTLPPGPPDRLDLSSLTSQQTEALDQARLRFVRYMVMTETFVDDIDNDYDNLVDDADNDIGGVTIDIAAGDLIPIEHREDYHPVTKKILALSMFQLHRAMGVYGRIPARTMLDWDPNYETARTDENIGSYIYDLQFEFYGKIAIALKDDGSPEVWGVGWGYQDVRGEDVGTDCGGALTDTNDLGAYAIKSGSVSVTNSSATVTHGLAGLAVDDLKGGTFFIWPSTYGPTDTFDTADPDNDVYTITGNDATTLTLNREYKGTGGTFAYRIIEPTQANGILDAGEDVGADGIANDPLDDSSGIANNVSNNNGDPSGEEYSVGERNKRLDSRVMGIWDSRSPDPRNPRRAKELNGWDDDGDFTTLSDDGIDNDGDGQVDDRLDTYLDKDGAIQSSAGAQHEVYATPELDDDPPMTPEDDGNDLLDTDTDTVTYRPNSVDDRFYEAAGKPEGVDEPDEADPYDDSLPKAVRITIAIRDPQQSLEPIIVSTTVWLSTAK